MPTAISQLPEIADADFSSDDCFVVVDTNDISSAPTGTTKKITKLAAFTNVVITTALKFADAVGKIIPGATSLSFRNHADDADNLLLADNGDVTIRSKWRFASALSKIIPGATSLSVRNNADDQDNLLVADNGSVTVRNAVSAAEVRSSALFTASGDGWSLKNHDGSKTYLQASTLGALTVLSTISSGGHLVVTGDGTGHFFLTAVTAPASPANGEFWFDGTDFLMRAGGTTYKFTKTAV